MVCRWSGAGSGDGGSLQEVERADEVILEFLSRDNGVKEALFKQELGALKALRELLPDGLLDNSRTCEADERSGLGDVQVAEHGEAGGDAAGGGVSENTDVRHAGIVKLAQRGGNFGHLHQAHHTFHHACAAAGRDDDERDAFRAGSINGAGNGFSHDGAHGAAYKAVLHGAENHAVRAELADGVQDRVIKARGLLGLFQALFIGLHVNEVERIRGAQTAVDELKAGIEEQLNALLRA